MKITKISKKANALLLIKYLSVGGLTTLGYFALFFLFWRFFSLPKLIAVSIAYSLFLVMNFLSHQTVTFQSHNKKTSPQIVRYLLLVGFSFILTLLIIHILSDILNFYPMISVIISSVVTTFIGFTLSKYWVYH